MGITEKTLHKAGNLPYYSVGEDSSYFEGFLATVSVYQEAIEKYAIDIKKLSESIGLSEKDTMKEIEKILVSNKVRESVHIGNKTFYGIFKNYKGNDEDETTLVDYYATSDAACAEKIAKRMAAERNDERGTDEKRYIRYSVRKLTSKYLSSEEFVKLYDTRMYNKIYKEIIEEAEYKCKEYELSKSEAKTVVRDLIRINKLTYDDLCNWDWSNFKIKDKNADEYISVSCRTSIWTTHVESSITLNGKEYTAKSSVSGDVTGI